MTTISKKTMSEMRKQSKKFTNSLVEESNKIKKQSINNSKALIELDIKSKKKPVKNNPTVVKKHGKKEAIGQLVILIFFWIYFIVAFISSFLGINITI